MLANIILFSSYISAASVMQIFLWAFLTSSILLFLLLINHRAAQLCFPQTQSKSSEDS